MPSSAAIAILNVQQIRLDREQLRHSPGIAGNDESFVITVGVAGTAITGP